MTGKVGIDRMGYYPHPWFTEEGCLYLTYSNGTGAQYTSGSAAAVVVDSDLQMSSYGPRSKNELRPKTKFYNLLIYAGYPNK